MYRSSPCRSTVNTGYITGLDMCKECYRSSPFHRTVNTGYITGLDMCKVCTEAVHAVALWTRVTLQVWTYEAVHSVALRTRVTLQVWSMYRSSPFRSTVNTGYITGLDMCKVCTEAVHAVCTVNTGYIPGLDMCKVCTEAVHSVALWTLVTLHVWTCVKYVPKQSMP